jgi:hypothetical protein
VRLLDVTGLSKHKGVISERRSVPPMISIVGCDGRPQRVRADAPLWWELDEGLFDKALAARDRRNGKAGPIKIKTFQV